MFCFESHIAQDPPHPSLFIYLDNSCEKDIDDAIGELIGQTSILSTAAFV